MKVQTRKMGHGPSPYGGTAWPRMIYKTKAAIETVDAVTRDSELPRPQLQGSASQETQAQSERAREDLDEDARRQAVEDEADEREVKEILYRFSSTEPEANRPVTAISILPSYMRKPIPSSPPTSVAPSPAYTPMAMSSMPPRPRETLPNDPGALTPPNIPVFLSQEYGMGKRDAKIFNRTFRTAGPHVILETPPIDISKIKEHDIFIHLDSNGRRIWRATANLSWVAVEPEEQHPANPKYALYVASDNWVVRWLLKKTISTYKSRAKKNPPIIVQHRDIAR